MAARITTKQLQVQIDDLKRQIQWLNEELSAKISAQLDAKLDAQRTPRQPSLIEGHGTDGEIVVRKPVTNQYGQFFNIKFRGEPVDAQAIAAELGINVRKVDPPRQDRNGFWWTNVYPSGA